MPDARAVGLVALGGALGAVLRYLVTTALVRWPWPAGTLLVNVGGSFALAWLIFHDPSADATAPWRTFLGMGLLGAFTTMSAVAYETVDTAADGALGRAALWALLNVALSVTAAFAGRATALALR